MGGVSQTPPVSLPLYLSAFHPLNGRTGGLLQKMSFSRHPFLLAYTKYLAAYTKFHSVNQQVKLQCMQCMQKLKIKFPEL